VGGMYGLMMTVCGVVEIEECDRMLGYRVYKRSIEKKAERTVLGHHSRWRMPG